MNVENFSQYLRQPALLYQLNYQELKNLVLEYPYAANLRLLLLLKAKMENDDQIDQYLEKAAIHSFDRSFLYDLMQDVQPEALIESLELGEEYLELKSLSELVDLSPESRTTTNQDKTPIANEPIPKAAKIEAVEEPIGPPVAEPKARVEELEPQPVSQPNNRKVEPLHLDLQSFAVMLEHLGLLPQPLPIPKERFLSWESKKKDLNRKDLAKRLAANRKRQLAKAKQKTGQPPKVKKKQVVKQIAKQSLADHPDLASETLANLLVRQERFDKAIKMYERLSLKFPEKSSYFAGIIEDLKQKF